MWETVLCGRRPVPFIKSSGTYEIGDFLIHAEIFVWKLLDTKLSSSFVSVKFKGLAGFIVSGIYLSSDSESKCPLTNESCRGFKVYRSDGNALLIIPPIPNHQGFDSCTYCEFFLSEIDWHKVIMVIYLKPQHSYR